MTIDPEQLFADYEARLAAVQRKAEQVSAGLTATSVTERSGDGQVTVTVNASGNVTDLRIAPGTRQGPELAAAIMVTMRRAQSRLVEAVQRTIPATVGAGLMAELTDQYRRAYPAPPPEPPRGHRRAMRLGADNATAPSRPPRRRPASGDDSDFSDRGLLR
ncbi:YbaB/EbfC family nucleoid-associated protein [Actinophytocola sp. KF-1]